MDIETEKLAQQRSELIETVNTLIEKKHASDDAEESKLLGSQIKVLQDQIAGIRQQLGMDTNSNRGAGDGIRCRDKVIINVCRGFFTVKDWADILIEADRRIEFGKAKIAAKVEPADYVDLPPELIGQLSKPLQHDILKLKESS